MGINMNLNFKKIFFSLVILFTIFACNTFPYRETNKIYKKQSKLLLEQVKVQPFEIVDTLNGISAPEWVGTTNFDLRKPNFVIIHHTAQNSCEQTLKTFTLERTKVSAHYVICKDGTVHHMLNDYFRAWHGGVAKWGNNSDINSSSIGIEIDNNGFEPFETKQISSLLNLLSILKNKYNIPASNFIGHGDIAPTRKNDPNINFPWSLLAQNGYGEWYDPKASFTLQNNISIPYALALIGYDVKDTSAAILAFKRHFRQDSSAIINDDDKSVMAQIIQHKLAIK
jgi:N-acetylmuramoyl-L-alanine amidase